MKVARTLPLRSTIGALSAITRYRMVAGDRSQTASAEAVQDDKVTFVAPLHDASWPDDALVGVYIQR